MKTRIFLLGTQGYGSSHRITEELKQIFCNHLSDDGDIGHFASVKEASAEIAGAVTQAHVLVFIADTAQYASTKLMLGKAFGFEMGCDSALLEKACAAFDKDPQGEDYEFSVAHAFTEKNSKTFVLDDGLWAGFAIANGNQTVIILPYEKDRTSYLISSQVVPYLNAAYNAQLSVDKIREYNANRLFELLDSHGAELAVAGTNTATFLKEYLSVDERLEERVRVSPVVEKRGEMQPVDYVVNLSITASEFLGCRYSVAISNAFYTGDSPESEKIVYLAVSNERETAVREIHSLPGEELSAFLSRCCGDLCAFVGDVVADDDGFSSDMKVRENAAVRRYKIAIAAVAAVIVALAVFIAAFFTANDYSLKSWYDSFMEWVFPAGDPFKDLFGSKLPGGDEADESTEASATQEHTTEDATTEEDTTEEESTDEDASAEETTREAASQMEESSSQEQATEDEIILVG